MNQRARIGIGGVLLIAIVALLFGAVGGAIAGARFSDTKIVKQVSVNPSLPVSNSDTNSNQTLSWTQVVQQAGPAVVTIINQQQPQQDLFGNTYPGAKAEGSGFVVDQKGDIVTNNHVVSGAQSLTVVFSDGHKASAQVVRADPLSDLAVVKVNAKVPAVLSFGSSSALQPGNPVLAIGSALGEFRNTATAGIVSAKGRTITEENGVNLHDMVQTDAAINQGNSGGPLLNDHGQVVGVNTAITRGASSSNIFGLSQSVVAEGLGFAIPSDTVKNVAARLASNKPPAYLGVTYHSVSSQDSTFYNIPVGAYVNTVVPGSPADKAGIKTRDVITKVDNQQINDSTPLDQVISAHAPGDKVMVTYTRGNQQHTVQVTLAAKPSH